MSTEYERVLREWALGMVPADEKAVKVTNVDTWYYQGFGGSDVTPPEDPMLGIRIEYENEAGAAGSYMFGHDGLDATALRMTELLQALFRIAEGADHDG